MEQGGAAPTGCYKCGRPGHWSRDCPSNPNPNPSSNSSAFKASAEGSGRGFGGPVPKPSEKPKKVPRTRPKLTPELLLSDDGIGYVLRHFPRAFKFRGRGHEVSDLGNLIGLYAQWHSHLLPYYSFDQFVHKVEQVGATRRVKTCLGGLRDKVANGGDPTNFHESLVEHDISNNEEGPTSVHEDSSLKNNETDDLQEDMLQEIHKQATEQQQQPSPAFNGDAVATHQANQAPDNIVSNTSSQIHISEDQKARMEANRLKALERAAAAAAARASSSKTA
ncbi:uncharacterized protein LOC127810615 isoform X2 [Diospyros lotus]|uniref:uncharacterized protein LOC127810615 isoform X2 n=1 Tax=Diospyros lotus TaxID=55363 RepID=UPI002257A430|nr:uncharacterized protein LOC127810615 isoform X2 [Diospyros lotus]